MSNIVHQKSNSEIKFVYSDNNTLSVIFQNNDLLLGVVGEFNCNLKELEKITETNIYSRGNSILIKSEQMASIFYYSYNNQLNLLSCLLDER